MKKKALFVFGLTLVLVLALSLSAFAANDLKSFPDPVDPISWELPENMTWDDWTSIPSAVVDWDAIDLPNATLQKGLVILVDYQDEDFVLTLPKGSDPMGNPRIDPVPREDLAEWWEGFLNTPSPLNHYTTINDYWRENSYGNWKVEIKVCGPYRLEGYAWEYGVDDMNGARASKRDLIKEAMAAYVADTDPNRPKLEDFNFGFLVHCGYCESAVWEEMGLMLTGNPDSLGKEWGPKDYELQQIKEWGAKPLGNAEPIVVESRWGSYVANDISWAEPLFNGKNYVDTRYVDWTTWYAGRCVWSFASRYTAVEGDGTGMTPGTSFRLSVQGEDGMATFAH